MLPDLFGVTLEKFPDVFNCLAPRHKGPCRGAKGAAKAASAHAAYSLAAKAESAKADALEKAEAARAHETKKKSMPTRWNRSQAQSDAHAKAESANRKAARAARLNGDEKGHAHHTAEASRHETAKKKHKVHYRQPFSGD